MLNLHLYQPYSPTQTFIRPPHTIPPYPFLYLPTSISTHVHITALHPTLPHSDPTHFYIYSTSTTTHRTHPTQTFIHPPTQFHPTLSYLCPPPSLPTSISQHYTLPYPIPTLPTLTYTQPLPVSTILNPPKPTHPIPTQPTLTSTHLHLYLRPYHSTTSYPSHTEER